MLHASHNLFIKNIYTPLTRNTGVTPYVIDEFGIGLVITIGLAALIVWKKNENKNLRPT